MRGLEWVCVQATQVVVSNDCGAEEDVDLRDYWVLVEACVLFYTSHRCTTSNHKSFDESIHNAWMHKLICERIVFIAP